MTMETVMRLPKFDANDIGSIIGPSAKACKEKSFLSKLPSLRNNVITPSWRSYKLYKEENKLEGEDPKTPYIQLDSDEEGVYATIKGDSEQMLKFVQFHLNKYEDSFVKPKKKMVHSFYASMDHSMIPRLIGRGGSGVQSMRTEAVSGMEEEIDVADLAECEKAYLKVDRFTPRDFSDFSSMVEDSEKSSFVGWTPDEEDPLVKVFVTSYASEEAFSDFIASLNDVIADRVKDFKETRREFTKTKDQELQDIQDALNKEW